jgi:hypothetical protein
MSPGRHTKGVGHVDRLEGDEPAKQRLKAILATFTGQWSVAEASRQLGLSPSRFARLRAVALQGALDSLAPRPVGRPAEEISESAWLRERVDQLRQEDEGLRAMMRNVLEMTLRMVKKGGENWESFPGEGGKKKAP